MLDMIEIRQQLLDRNAEAVAREAGVHANTVREIRRNPDANPSWQTVKKLSDYLEGVQNDNNQKE